MGSRKPGFLTREKSRGVGGVGGVGRVGGMGRVGGVGGVGGGEDGEEIFPPTLPSLPTLPPLPTLPVPLECVTLVVHILMPCFQFQRECLIKFGYHSCEKTERSPLSVRLKSK
ncbi:hypothetical protein H6G74_07495 [Nostoc spongiaeforme FACHB-130]|uniref:Uncharacterized protein n=1 Tax=Nostoc spongiaeforme FACHB-130 TaxID=1357510 RepID=A0ABR8FRY5_9NOSO|nr:hypothetical protein [Nostoc spongiaeforme]MBD2594173.1 hypothetical protein [Nostoc spongiaeforme FACHB-130]